MITETGMLLLVGLVIINVALSGLQLMIAEGER